ncbi:hypothetical protein FD755_016735 [Muntiacus reevesi]|uniref:Microcephalin n=1 Tax=Muntiacus reevesi TaxID=9886 RepID=A0A5N3XCI3_MUNRE|nr:hypothetical protein FD755_016735 [Muntiacus reevesi]
MLSSGERPQCSFLGNPTDRRASWATVHDVVAYVEVWSANGTENYSRTFRKVTHVVFKDGYPSTWEKAQKRGVKLVSVLWVEKVGGAHVDESLFPAANTNQHLPSLLKRKRKCMQPKEFSPKTPENEKRLQKIFEKMAKELQQQQTTLGTNVPVLLFESNGSLVYSPTGKVYRGHHSAMKKRLQEMEKRENLSPTSSQMIEQSDDNTVNSLREASLNLSHDALCSDSSSAGDLPMSADDPCGGSASGTRERKWGECITERESDLRAASPVLQTGRGGPSAAPRPLGLWTPPRSTSSPPKAETPQLSRAAGGVVTPVSKPSRPAAQGLSGGQRRLSPVSSATKGRPEGRAQAMGSSVKRSKTPENWPASEEGRKRRRSLRQRLRLREAESGLRSVRRPAVRSLALQGSSHDDYLSPGNLKQRVSEGLLGEQLPSSPLRCEARGAFPRARGPASWTGLASPSSQGPQTRRRHLLRGEAWPLPGGACALRGRRGAGRHSEGGLNAVGGCAEEGSAERGAPAQGMLKLRQQSPHARPPCPSPTPGVYSNSCPSISSSNQVANQSTGVSASASPPACTINFLVTYLTQFLCWCLVDAIQPSHPLLSPSPPTFNFSQHQGLSNESVLQIRWPKYWSFSFSISPSSEYSELISFRMDWLDLFASNVKRLVLNHSKPCPKQSSLLCTHSAMSPSHPTASSGGFICIIA